eukprot:TRINITY_DN49679_c0_g1_i1.p1 TRINITY_DN49679_c0_g1~~TRINITY_DN49679_c0_g1_i1.p1  ORF type:complete len:246 (+),score=17.83 TRINITY_DN49679_c0_g1_i1:31-738(+)
MSTTSSSAFAYFGRGVSDESQLPSTADFKPEIFEQAKQEGIDLFASSPCRPSTAPAFTSLSAQLSLQNCGPGGKESMLLRSGSWASTRGSRFPTALSRARSCAGLGGTGVITETSDGTRSSRLCVRPKWNSSCNPGPRTGGSFSYYTSRREDDNANVGCGTGSLESWARNSRVRAITQMLGSKIQKADVWDSVGTLGSLSVRHQDHGRFVRTCESHGALDRISQYKAHHMSQWVA